MKHELNRSVTLTLEGDDIDKPRKAVMKVNDELCKPGFRNSNLTEEDADILRDLENNLPK